MRKRAFLPPDLRSQTRSKRLGDLFLRGDETSFFGERLSNAGLNGMATRTEDAFGLLKRLDPIGKKEIAVRFPDGVITRDRAERRSYRKTSGTTGDRMTVVTNFERRESGRASSMYSLDVATGRSLGLSLVDIPPNACNTVCGLEGPPITTWVELFSRGIKNRELLTSSFRSEIHGMFERRVLLHQDILPPLDARSQEGLASQIESSWRAIGDINPEVIRAFPQYLLWLAESDCARNRKPTALRFAMPYGGLGSDSLFARVRNALGIETRNSYGTSELGSIAISCNNSGAMHVIEDLFEVEVLRDGKPVADGQIGEIVVTDLTNTAMPLIRYRVGDSGRFVQGQCQCGRTTKRVEILGRMQETIRQGDHWITARDIAEIAYSDRGVGNFRIDQIGSNQFEMQIAPSLSGKQPEVESIKEQLVNLFSEPVKITHRVVPYIPPEPNGKFLTCRLRAPRVERLKTL